MKKFTLITIIAIVSLVFASPAFSCEGNCHHGKKGGNAYATGGTGIGVGVGVGIGISDVDVDVKNNIHNKNMNKNTNMNMNMNKNTNMNMNKNTNMNMNKNTNMNTNKVVNSGNSKSIIKNSGNSESNSNAIIGDISNDSASNSNATVGDVSNTNTTIVEAPDLNDGRAFANAAEMNYPGLIGYNGPAAASHRFMPLRELLRYNTKWDVKKAQNMLDGYTGKKIVRVRDMFSLKNVKHSKIVTCSTDTPNGTITEIAVGTVAADGTMAISADVFAKILVEASIRGANYIHFTSEGVNMKVRSFGWGLGLSYTSARITGPGNNQSSVGSGGTGISGASAGYDALPWLQFHFLRVE